MISTNGLFNATSKNFNHAMKVFFRSPNASKNLSVLVYFAFMVCHSILLRPQNTTAQTSVSPTDSIKSLPSQVPTNQEKLSKLKDMQPKSGKNRASPENKSLENENSTDSFDSLLPDSKVISAIDLELPISKEAAAVRSEAINRYYLPMPTLLPPPIMQWIKNSDVQMKVEIAEPAIKTNTKWLWSVNDLVLCDKSECIIPKATLLLLPNDGSLKILMYNSFGSVTTTHKFSLIDLPDHVITNNKASAARQTISGITVPQNIYAEMTSQKKQKISMDAMRGLAIYQNDQGLSVIGKSIKSEKEWTGTIKVGKNGVVRIQEEKKYTLFGLTKTIFKAGKSKSLALGSLVVGAARLKAYAENKTPIVFNTEEVEITLLEGAEAYIYRSLVLDNVTNKKKMFTRVVSLSKNLELEIKAGDKKGKKMKIPPGVEIVIDENGFISELGKPNPKNVERLIRLTTTQEELDELEREKIKQKNAKLEPILVQVKEALEREDYFDVQTIVLPIQDRFKENELILFYLGLAAKNLYQLEAAEKYFQTNLKQYPEHGLTAFQLMQIKMEVSQWPAAQAFAEKAEDNLPPASLEQKEFNYYAGVIHYNLKNDFKAKNYLMKVLWDTEIDQSLKQSSGALLAEIGKRHSVNVVAILGGQWDPNPNGLTQAEKKVLPTQQQNTRAIFGTIFSRDSSAAAKDSGVYFGYGAKAIGIRNFPKAYANKNATVADVSLSQTFVGKVAEPNEALGEKDNKNQPTQTEKKAETKTDTKSQQAKKQEQGKSTSNSEDTTNNDSNTKYEPILKTSQTLGATWLLSKMISQTFNIAVQKQKFSAGATYTLDKLTRRENDTLGFEQSMGAEVGKIGSVTLDSDIILEETIQLKKTDLARNKLKIGSTPSFTLPLGAKFIPRLSLGLSYERHLLTKPVSTSKFTPALSAIWFLKPYLLLLPGANWEITKDSLTKKTVHKPGISGTLTGLF